VRRALLALGITGLLVGFAPAQDAGGKPQGAAPEHVDLDAPATPEELRLMARTNLCRQVAGLAPLTLDPALSRGVRLHGWWMDRNGKQQHEEDAGSIGFTQDGHNAGMSSVLSFDGNPESDAQGCIDSFYHRMPLLRPGLHRAGAGFVRGGSLCTGAIDTLRGDDLARERDAVVLWPPPDMQGARANMAYEDPNPTTHARSDQAGYPVTATFHPNAKVTNARATLRQGTAAVECWYSSPEKPQSTERPALQRNTIALIPFKPLRHKRVYAVEMAATVDGQEWTASWSFLVGNPRDGVKWMEGVLQQRAVAAHKARKKLERERDALVRKLKYAQPDARPALLAEAKALLARLPENLRPPLQDLLE
jgi:hypothetical protein